MITCFDNNPLMNDDDRAFASASAAVVPIRSQIHVSRLCSKINLGSLLIRFKYSVAVAVVLVFHDFLNKVACRCCGCC